MCACKNSLELAYLTLIQRNVMRYRHLHVITNSFPTSCEMGVVNIYLQTEVTVLFTKTTQNHRKALTLQL